jgi:AAA+ superfamily predicted ATPase
VTPHLADAGLDGLLPALHRLDQLLERAVAAAAVAYGREAAGDPFRGLHLGPADVERLLAREPGSTLLADDAARWTAARPEDTQELAAPLSGQASRLIWLGRAFGLSPLDLDLVVVALAPELDLRYQQLYAYLQDDVTRRRPTVELALNLLCGSAHAKLAARERFTPSAPLLRHGLLYLVPTAQELHPPLLEHHLKLDDQIVEALLGQNGLDRRLADCCELVEPTGPLDEPPLPERTVAALRGLGQRGAPGRQTVRLHFSGPDGGGKRRAAEALAYELDAPLLRASLVRVIARDDFEATMRLLVREAWLRQAVLYLDDLDVLRHEERALQYQSLLAAVRERSGITILAGSRPWAPAHDGPTGIVTVPFPVPDFQRRRICWQAQLTAAEIDLENHELDVLADRFRLDTDQIADAVHTAHAHTVWRVAARPGDEHSSAQPTVDDLLTAARAQSGEELASLARKVTPLHTWDDIVLPQDVAAQLRDLCQRVTHRQQVLGRWGFERRLSLGKGTSALFAGPSGTGKTMAAEIIAGSLGLDLYAIDLSGVVSKYIGETEKNLARIFTAAETANAILLFDEADALFGKRSEVRDSHDRYANIEISYLLQRMEAYEGVTILTTNLRENLDEAFVRRLAFIVHFPFPDEAHRRCIWARVWPMETPLAADVDLDALASRFKLSGGDIKNVALSAAFMAVPSGGPVTMSHLLTATRREHQKLGKTHPAALAVSGGSRP